MQNLYSSLYSPATISSHYNNLLVTLFVMRVKLFRKVEDEAKNHESDVVGSRNLPLCGEK